MKRILKFIGCLALAFAGMGAFAADYADDLYDAMMTGGKVTVAESVDLSGKASSSPIGKMIELTNDLELTVPENVTVSFGACMLYTTSNLTINGKGTLVFNNPFGVVIDAADSAYSIVHTLKISDVTVRNTYAKAINSTGSSGTILVFQNQVAELNNVTVETVEMPGVYCCGGKTTINGGRLMGSTSYFGQIIAESNSMAKEPVAYLTVNGNAVIGSENDVKALYAGVKSNVTLNDGTYTAKCVSEKYVPGPLIDICGDNIAVAINGGTYRALNNYCIARASGWTETGYVIKGGTFSSDPRLGQYTAYEPGNPDKKIVMAAAVDFIPEGHVVVENGDGTWTVAVKTSDNTVVTTAPQESKVELKDEERGEVFANVSEGKVEEIVEKVKTNTKVEGVVLTMAPATEGKKSGIEAVVEAAKADEALAGATALSVKVEVVVTPTKFDGAESHAQVAFKLEPKATVTVGSGEAAKSAEVPVTNDMIDKGQKISVSIYTGFRPSVITHDTDDGVRIETFTGDQIAYDETTGIASVRISHFSVLGGYLDANDAPPAPVARIGATLYASINEAFSAVNGLPGDSAIIEILSNVTEDLATNYEFNKDVTLTASQPVCLTFKFDATYYGCAAGKTFTIDSNVEIKNGMLGVKNGGKTVLKGKVTPYAAYLTGTSLDILPGARYIQDNADVLAFLRMGASEKSVLNVTGTLENPAASQTVPTDWQVQNASLSSGGDGIKELNFDKAAVWLCHTDTGAAGVIFNINLAESYYRCKDSGFLQTIDKLTMTGNSVMEADSSDYSSTCTTLRGEAVIQAGSVIRTQSTFVNNGTIKIDLTGATEKSYTVFDFQGKGKIAGSGSVELINVAEGSAYEVVTEDGNLVVRGLVAKIGDKSYDSFTAAVAEAETGDVVEIVAAGTYSMVGLPKNIVVSGAVEGVVFDCKGPDRSSIASIPAGATFDNLTFIWGQTSYHGFQHPGTPIVFRNCTLNGLLFLYDTTEFYDCKFINHKLAEMEAAGQSTDGVKPEYCLWLYTSKNTIFERCSFDCEGKAVNVYNEGYEKVTTMYATGCSFKSDKTFENYYKDHGFAADPTKDPFKINAEFMTATTVIVDEENIKTEGSFAARPLAGGDPGDNVSKASIAIGTDIVLDEGTGKIVSGTFTQFDVGADVPAVNAPLAETSVLKPTGDGKIAAEPVEEFAGTGTSADPYQIKSLDQLILFRQRINSGLMPYAGNSAYYKLVADIDLASVENWEPIGTAAKPFRGNFDGGNKTIRNLKINASGAYQGFFGVVTANGGDGPYPTLKNLTLENVDVSSSSGPYVGGFAGKIFCCTLENIVVIGSVYGYDQYVGGIAGHSYGTFRNCRFEGDVEGWHSVAGMTGSSGGTKFYDCVVIGDITGWGWVGGIVGNGQENTSCYGCMVKGTVNADVNYAGGTGGIAGEAGFGGNNNNVFNDNYFDGVVVIGGKEFGNPIIGAVNSGSEDAAAVTVEGNSWNTAKIAADVTVAVAGSDDLPGYPTEVEVREKAAKTEDRNHNLVGSAEDFKYVAGGVVAVAKGTEISEMSAEVLKTAIVATAENPDIAEVIINADGKVEVLMAVAKIGDKLYATLEKAAATATEGQTITLTDNIDLSGYGRSEGHDITFADNVTFDLAGFTVSMNNFGVEFLGNGLTVSNGTFKSVGVNPNYSVFFGDWKSEDPAKYTGLTLVDLTCEGGVNVYKTQDVLFRNLQVTEAAAKNMFYAVNASGGSKVTIEGGSYESSVTDNAILLRAGTDADAYTIKSGSFRAVDRTDVTLCAAGKATVYGGTFGMDPTAFLADGYAAKQGTDPRTWTVVEKQTEVVVENAKVLDADGNPIESGSAAEQAAAIKNSVVGMVTSAAVAGFAETAIKATTTKDDGLMVEPLVNAFGMTGDDRAALAASTLNHEWLSNSLDKVQCEVSGDAASLKRLVYEVKPYATVTYTMGQEVTKQTVAIPNSVFVGKPITFRLGVTWDFGDQVKVWRDGNYFGLTTVKNDGDVNFVEIKSDHFCEFALEKVATQTPTVCEVNGLAYESVTEAIVANTESPTAVFKLKAPCSDEGLALLEGQTIDLNGLAFTGSIAPVDVDHEQVTYDDKVFNAYKPKLIELSTGDKLPVRVAPAVFVTWKDASGTFVKGDNGMEKWKNDVLGVDGSVAANKIVPMMVKAAAGSSVVTIKTPIAAFAPLRKSGVKVQYSLLKRNGGGEFVRYGESKDTPVFTVDVSAIETQTFWKIQVSYEKEY